MKEDKRRKPYNLWLYVLGILLTLMVSGVGSFIIYCGTASENDVDSDIIFENGYDFEGFIRNIRLKCIGNTTCNLENVEVGYHILTKKEHDYYYYESLIPLENTVPPSIITHENSNWQLYLTKIVMSIIGSIIVLIGICVGGGYIENHLWGKGDKFKK